MTDAIPRFDRQFFTSRERFTRIGEGAPGGKAAGLLRAHRLLQAAGGRGAPDGLEIEIPALTVLTTDLFEAFLERNRLRALALSGEPDDRIALAFQQAALPAEIAGDLRALVEQAHTPLAVRSSGLLEDAKERPFAGVYSTKMIPNDQPDADTRFRKLVEAVKLVWASVFFAAARGYAEAAGRSTEEERMAVIVQEVVGRRRNGRFYPDVSAVARSIGWYRSGGARPEDGVVDLALGLGKTIVDGGLAWSYSPARPKAGPPFASAAALLRGTQRRFWAVRMGRPPAWDPIRETEYLVAADLAAAEEDGALRYTASTYDAAGDRLHPGTGRSGPRALTFAPLLVLEELPLNAAVRWLLATCERGLGEPVELELALVLRPPAEGPSRLGFVQVRPLAAAGAAVELTPAEQRGEAALLASDDVMGNGVAEGIEDVIYVKPGGFEARHTRAAAAEIAALNRALLEQDRHCVLIGFGRWGSSDPSLGIPVQWSEISSARALVEATLPAMDVEASQGSHFFHNLASFGVSYFCVHHGRDRLDWEWLAAQPAVADLEHVRHVRLGLPLLVKVDGRTGRGVILRGGGPT